MMEGPSLPAGSEQDVPSLVSLPTNFESLHFFYGNEETGGRPVGPCSWGVLQGLWIKGDISLETLIWCKGMKRQEAISNVDGLPMLLAAALAPKAEGGDDEQGADEEEKDQSEDTEHAGSQMSEIVQGSAALGPPSKILHAGSLGGSANLRNVHASHAFPTGSSPNLAALEETAAQNAEEGSRAERLESLETEMAEMRRLLRRSSTEGKGSMRRVGSSGRSSYSAPEAPGVGSMQEGVQEGETGAAALPPVPSRKIKRRSKRSAERDGRDVHSGSLGGEQVLGTRTVDTGSLGGAPAEPQEASELELVVTESEAASMAGLPPTQHASGELEKKVKSKKSRGDKPKRKKKMSATEVDSGLEATRTEQRAGLGESSAGPEGEDGPDQQRRRSSKRSARESKRLSRSSCAAFEYGSLEEGVPPQEADDVVGQENGMEEAGAERVDEQSRNSQDERKLTTETQTTNDEEKGAEEGPVIVVGSFSSDGSVEVKAAGASQEGEGPTAGSHEEQLRNGSLSQKSSTGSVAHTPIRQSREFSFESRARPAPSASYEMQSMTSRARLSSTDADDRSGSVMKREATYLALAGKKSAQVRSRKYILDSASEDSSDGESVNQEALPSWAEPEVKKRVFDTTRAEQRQRRLSDGQPESEKNEPGPERKPGSTVEMDGTPADADVSSDDSAEPQSGPQMAKRSPLPFLGSYFRGRSPFSKPSRTAKASQTVERALLGAGTQDQYSTLAGAHSGPTLGSPPALSAESSFREALSQVVAENAALQGSKAGEAGSGERTPSEDGAVAAEPVLAGLSREAVEAKCVRLAKKVRLLREQNEELSALLLLRRSQSADAGDSPSQGLDRVTALISLAQRFSVVKELISPRPGSKSADMTKIRELELKLAQLAELLEGAALELQEAERKAQTNDTELGSQSRRGSSREVRRSIARVSEEAHEEPRTETTIDAQSSVGTPAAAKAEPLSAAQLADLRSYTSCSPRSGLGTPPLLPCQVDKSRPLLRSVSAEARRRAMAQQVDHAVRSLHQAYRARTGRKLPLQKVEEGVYKLANKKVHLVVANDRLCLKAGGGLQDFAEYLGRTKIRATP